jgi:hypothetical protein
MDWQSDLKKFNAARIDYESRIAGMQDDINGLVSSAKPLEEIKVDQRATID